MRQRERILRVAVESAEKLGLNPKDKETIDLLLDKKDNIKSSNPSKEEKEEVKTTEVESPVKKKNPFPPRKKKEEKILENTDSKSIVE